MADPKQTPLEQVEQAEQEKVDIKREAQAPLEEPVAPDNTSVNAPVVESPTRHGDNPGQAALFWLVAMALASDAINRRAAASELKIDIFDNPGNVVNSVYDFCIDGGLTYVSVLPHEFLRADDIEKILEHFYMIAQETDEQLQAVIDFDEEDEKADSHNEAIDKQMQILFYAWIVRVQEIKEALEALVEQLGDKPEIVDLMRTNTEELIDNLKENLSAVLTNKYKNILDFATTYYEDHGQSLSPSEALDFILGSSLVQQALNKEEKLAPSNSNN